MGGFAFGEFFNILCWVFLVAGTAWLLILGFEKVRRRKVPDVLKGVILIPVALSIAFSCAANFPIPI